MKKPVIEKVTVNIGVGEGGEKLERAVALLEKLTGRKPIRTKTMKRIPLFGIRPNMFVGTMVTLRGKEAEDFLKLGFVAHSNEIKSKSFDKNGNLSFGIKEYIDLPNVRYDPEIGVFGMDICVSLGRPGFRVKRRKVKASSIGQKHLLTRQEAIDFIKEKFKVEVI